MTDQAIATIARLLAAALAQVGYSRHVSDRQEVARLQTELCAAVRLEEQEAKAGCDATSNQQES
jgi:hypothetical protein